jgi:hypothetical protein
MGIWSAMRGVFSPRTERIEVGDIQYAISDLLNPWLDRKYPDRAADATPQSVMLQETEWVRIQKEVFKSVATVQAVLNDSAFLRSTFKQPFADIPQLYEQKVITA